LRRGTRHRGFPQRGKHSECLERKTAELARLSSDKDVFEEALGEVQRKLAAAVADASAKGDKLAALAAELSDVKETHIAAMSRQNTKLSDVNDKWERKERLLESELEAQTARLARAQKTSGAREEWERWLEEQFVLMTARDRWEQDVYEASLSGLSDVGEAECKTERRESVFARMASRPSMRLERRRSSSVGTPSTRYNLGAGGSTPSAALQQYRMNIGAPHSRSASPTSEVGSILRASSYDQLEQTHDSARELEAAKRRAVVAETSLQEERKGREKLLREVAEMKKRVEEADEDVKEAGNAQMELLDRLRAARAEKERLTQELDEARARVSAAGARDPSSAGEMPECLSVASPDSGLLSSSVIILPEVTLHQELEALRKELAQQQEMTKKMEELATRKAEEGLELLRRAEETHNERLERRVRERTGSIVGELTEKLRRAEARNRGKVSRSHSSHCIDHRRATLTPGGLTSPLGAAAVRRKRTSLSDLPVSVDSAE